MIHRARLYLTCAAAILASPPLSAAGPVKTRTNAFVATPLVSDLPGVAPNQDANMHNAWGVVFTPSGSPFWVCDKNSGVSTLYRGDGTPLSLVVTIPSPGGGTSAPTGIVWNPSTSQFMIPNTMTASSFIFATEDGTIAAWAGSLSPNTSAVIAVDNSQAGAFYTGLAYGLNESGPFLFAANFRAGTVDVFDQHFNAATATGGFADPGVPKGYAPFGIANIDGALYVTYAEQNAAKNYDVAGAGKGFVDIFDTDGNLLLRLASRGELNAPWGVARAPFGFGAFSGQILVGNFGNGWINVFDPSGKKLGYLDDAATGGPLVIDGLWALILGGGSGSNSNTLFYTAGPNGEADGQFGTIAAAQ